MKKATIIWDDGSQAYCIDFRGNMSDDDINIINQHLPVETYLTVGNYHRFVMKSIFDINNKKQFVFLPIVLDIKLYDKEDIDNTVFPIDRILENYTVDYMSDMITRIQNASITKS